MQALILAGGKGTRLRPLTMHTPKPIVPIANRPFLVYQLELLKRAEARDIIVSLSYQHQKIEDRLIDGTDYDVRIYYTIETMPMGTAGAYRNAASLISETTVVLNGDILSDVDLSDVIRFHQSRQAVATIVLASVPNPTEFGFVETDDESRIVKFVERPEANEVTSNTINAGIYILEPRVLDFIPSGEPFMFETGVFPKLLDKGEPFFGYTWHGYWRDIGVPSSYLQANLDVLNGKVNLLEKLPLETGPRFEKKTEIDPVSIIDPSCTLKTGVQIINSVIGRNCYIEERVVIENSVIRSGSRIGQLAQVRGAVVGKGCHIGRSVIVGEGAVLGDKSVVTDYSTVGRCPINPMSVDKRY